MDGRPRTPVCLFDVHVRHGHQPRLPEVLRPLSLVRRRVRVDEAHPGLFGHADTRSAHPQQVHFAPFILVALFGRWHSLHEAQDEVQDKA